MSDDGCHLATYVVRISRDASSRIRGVLVHVATGKRFAFDGLDHMTLLLQERLAIDMAEHT